MGQRYNIQMAIHQAVKNLTLKASDAIIESEILDIMEDAAREGFEVQKDYTMHIAVDRVRRLMHNREQGIGMFAR